MPYYHSGLPETPEEVARRVALGLVRIGESPEAAMAHAQARAALAAGADC
jgi:hypothetical protein